MARPRSTPGSNARDAFGPAVVVDATGQRVGSLLGAAGSDGVAVLLELSGRTVLLAVTGSRFFAEGLVAYEALNCAGSPWLLGPALVGVTALFDHVGVGPDLTLFGVDGPSQSPPLASVWDNNTLTPGCVNGPFSQPAFPAVPIRSLGAFTPPFTPR